MGATPALAEGNESETESAVAVVEPSSEITTAPVEEVTVDEPTPEEPAVEELPVEVPPPSAPPADLPADSPSPPPATEDDEGTQELPKAVVPATEKSASVPEPPYLRWRVVDEGGTVQQGVKIAVQGPNESAIDDESLWLDAPVTTVSDNIGQSGYVGADLDPTPGFFTVKQLADDANPAAIHDVATAEHYRVRPAEAPAGFGVGDEAAWTRIGSLGMVVSDADVQKVTLTAAAQARDGEVELFSEEGGDFTTFDAQPPYITWEVRDGSGILVTVGGATFTLQGPHNETANDGDANWGTSYTVTDCITGDCAGLLDRDPAPGKFQVDALDVEGMIPVDSALRYRVQQTQAPTGFNAPTDVAWRIIAGTGETAADGQWIDQDGALVHDFGIFVNTSSLGSVRTIQVNKRVISGSAAYTSGASFSLWTGGSGGPTAKVEQPWTTCIIVAGTSCNIYVPHSAIPGGGVQYWVVEDLPTAGTPAASTFPLGSIATGPATGNLNAPSPYPGRTPNITTASGTVQMPVSGTGQSGSIGETTNALKNPGLSAQCDVGLRIGLVLDRSTSIEAGPERTNYGNAIHELVTALITTEDNVLITPIMFNSGATTQAQQVASATLANNLRDTLQGGTGWVAATNWQAALNEAAAGNFDIVLMVTDGAPTLSNSTNAGNANDVRVHHVERAVLAANAVKNGGAPVLAIGVALPNNSVTNLTAISGTTPGVDYFTSGWADLGGQLAVIADGLQCRTTIQVNKTTISATGQEATGVGGWSFTAAQQSGSGTLAGGEKTTVAGPPSNGNVSWSHQFNALGQTATATITENLTPAQIDDGWALESVVCTGAEPTQSGDSWTITYGISTSPITCTATNKQAPKEASVKATKVWIVTDGSGQEISRSNDPSQPGDGALPAGISAQFSLSGPAPAGASDLAWGAVRGGYTVDDQVTISETVTIPASLPGCTIVSQQLTRVNGTEVDNVDLENTSYQLTLAARTPPTTPVVNLNELEVTNTLKCVANLSLLKHVDGGNAEASDWKLTATPGPTNGGGSTTTVTGNEAVVLTGPQSNTFEVVPAGEYGLSEALATGGSQIAYLLDRVEHCVDVAPGGASCLAWGPAVDASAVTVDLGKHEIYRFVNVPAPAVTVPLTGGVSGELFGIGGLGFAALAALLAIAYWHRTRRQQAGER